MMLRFIWTFANNVKGKVKVKHSHYRPMEPRVVWEVKAFRFRDFGT
jgi:hypothetical protein